jgi:hypothetical protein
MPCPSPRRARLHRAPPASRITFLRLSRQQYLRRYPALDRFQLGRMLLISFTVPLTTGFFFLLKFAYFVAVDRRRQGVFLAPRSRRGMPVDCFQCPHIYLTSQHARICSWCIF